MAHPIALDYIRKTRSESFSDAEIREELKKAGWPPQEIESAFSALQEPPQAGSSMPQFVSRRNVVEDYINKMRPSGYTETQATIAGPKKKSTAFVVGVVVSALAFGVAASGGFYWYTSVAPQRAVASAIEKLQNMESFRYKAELLITAKGTERTLTRNAASLLPPFAGVVLNVYSQNTVDDTESLAADAFRILAEGAVDGRSKDAPKHEFILTLGTDAIPGIGKNIEIGSKFIGDTYYFQLRQIPQFDSAAFLGYGVPRFTNETIVNKWVSFNPEAFARDYNSYIASLAAVDPSFSMYHIDTEAPTDLITKNEGERIRALWEKGTFVTWDRAVVSEQLEGRGAWRVKGRVNREELERFFEAAAAITGGSITERDRKAMFDTLGDIELNLWVSKDEERVVKATAHTIVSSPEVVSSGIIELLLGIDFVDAGADIAIEPPAESHDLSKVFSGIFADSLDTPEVRDARRVRDIANVQRHLKLYFARNKEYPKALKDLVPEYTAEMPTDPKTKKPYRYMRTKKNSYTLSAEFENKKHELLQYDANPKNTLYDVTEKDT